MSDVVLGAVLVVLVLVLVLTLMSKRKVDDVHVLVNSRMTDMIARVEQLVAALEASGADVPPPEHPRKEP